MQKIYTPARIVIIFIFIAILMTIFVSALYRIQVHETSRYGDHGATQQRIFTRRSTITAARGNIYDRHGVLLASGRPSYNIKLDWNVIRRNPAANEAILELIYATIDEGMTHNDTFPVTRRAPFEFVPMAENSPQRRRLEQYFDFFNIDPNIDVSDFLSWMRDHYGIDYTVGILDARLIMGVRYELEVRAIVRTMPSYIFATDVSTDFISYLNERSLLGVFTESTYVREYHTMHAPHMIGYVGAMTEAEFEHFRELGYPMDAIVGKIGAELAFEELLQGRNGQETIITTADGTVLSHEITIAPQPGHHVYLTLDLDLQRAVEQALQARIVEINLERIRDDLDTIPAGAVVVVNVNTGEVLAAASFPTFNLLTLAEDWADLQADPASPMLNRVTHGRYAPGSTFKMVTALAGFRHEVILNRYHPINCTGVFRLWQAPDGTGFAPRCWVHRDGVGMHGPLEFVPALEVSCNFYFLHIAHFLPEHQRDGGYILAGVAQEFGLGVPTGIELREGTGFLASPSTVEEVLDRVWRPADTLLAGFGQGHNRFTPLQLANYTATIANGGTLNSLTFLNRVYSAEFDLIRTHETEVISVIPETEIIGIIQDGMIAASRGRRGTAGAAFGPDVLPDLVVASKTGTVQVAEQAFNDGMFVAYAPARNPEIAIAVAVEKGGSGSEVMCIARAIFDHYFTQETSFLVRPYGEMVP